MELLSATPGQGAGKFDEAQREVITVQASRVLLIGGVVPRCVDSCPIDLQSYGVPDEAANVYQWNLIDGLERALQASVRIISVPFITSQRGRAARGRVPGFVWRHSGGDADASVGFINIFGLRNISRELALKRLLKGYLSSLSRDQERPLLVFVYAMHGPFLQALALIRRHLAQSRVCLVVPDLPQHMRDLTKAGPVVRMLKRLDIWRNRCCVRYVDKFVLISRHQAEILKIEDDSFVVVEGMVRGNAAPSGLPAVDSGQGALFTVVYTGGLDERNGIKDLVDAARHLKHDGFRLVFCGAGDLVSYVRGRAASDDRIILTGHVDHEESVSWQARADLLVNPRPGTAEFTRYSFASKTLEYLLAGKPVLAYRNDGTPSEYDEYLIYISEPGPEGIAAAIEAVMAMPESERQARGARGRAFVESEKSAERQMRKVLEFLGVAQ